MKPSSGNESVSLPPNPANQRNKSAGKSMPSITMLFQLCEYFEVSPRDFFDPGIKYPLTLQNILTCASHLNDDDLETLEMISRKLSMSPEDPEGSEE